jgi:hypothetical protein
VERDLREPTEPPHFGGWSAGRDRETSELLLAMSGEQPEPLVLHGPAGVGKSALAAEVTRHVDAPVHRITLGATVDVEQVLLRLLAECGASRVPIVRAAVRAPRGFGRALREQCDAFLDGRVVVLDGAGPSAALPLARRVRARSPTEGARHDPRRLGVGPERPSVRGPAAGSLALPDGRRGLRPDGLGGNRWPR